MNRTSRPLAAGSRTALCFGLVLGLAAWSWAAPTQAQTITSQRLFDTLVAHLNTDSPMRYRVEVSSVDKSRTAAPNLLDIYVGGFDASTHTAKTLVKFVEPATFKGRLFLYESGRLWVYFPNTNQPLRVPPQEQLFGDADVGSILDIDLRRYFKLAATTAEPSRTASPQEEILTLEPKAAEAPYGRLVFYFKDGKPIKGEYYALSGKLLKWATFDGYAMQRHKPYIQQVHVYSGTDTGAKEGTLIRYLSVEFMELPAVNFRPEYLKNIR